MYAVLKRWYRHASMRAPKPYRMDMEKVRGDFQTLSQREEPNPPIPPLEIHAEPARVNDEIPLEAEVEEEVRRLRPRRAGGHTHLHEEHFKQSWREV